MAKQFSVDTGGTLTTNLISYWKLDESSGGANDFQASNNLTNVNTVTYASGKISNAASFASASSQDLEVANGSQTGLNMTGNASFSLWVNFATLTGNYDYGVVSKYTSGLSGYKIVFYHDAGGHHIYCAIGSGATALATDRTWSPSTSTWYHVVVTYATGGTMKFYVNGSQQGATDSGQLSTIASSSATFYLGFATGEGYLNGLMDEVGVWNKTLTSTEITDLYNGGTGNSLNNAAAARNRLALLGVS